MAIILLNMKRWFNSQLSAKISNFIVMCYFVKYPDWQYSAVFINGNYYPANGNSLLKTYMLKFYDDFVCKICFFSITRNEVIIS